MNQSVVVAHPNAIWTGAQLNLIRRTVAADCNQAEFDLFITVARNAGLDPFRKQISAIVFNKNKPDRRRMAIITTIDGLRSIAARSRRYRPDEDEPSFEYDADLKGPTNPVGLVKANLRIWVMDAAREGGWRPVAGVAYWDEFAPISDEWAEGDDGKRRPTGKRVLDGGNNWGKMPRLMLAKCAEAGALRKAFPEDLSGLYEGAEMDQAQAIDPGDLTPSEVVGQFETESRLARIGGANRIHLQFSPASALEGLDLGKIADRVVEAVAGFGAYQQLAWFESVNTQPLRDFWARSPSDCLEIKKVIERRKAELLAADQGSAA